jgi:hypothetical protein
MYDKLLKVLAGFMSITFLLTCIERAAVVDDSSHNQVSHHHTSNIFGLVSPFHFFPLSWSSMWIFSAARDVLNFIILVIVALMWRPTRTSVLVLYSDQVPSVSSVDEAIRPTVNDMST